MDIRSCLAVFFSSSVGSTSPSEEKRGEGGTRGLGGIREEESGQIIFFGDSGHRGAFRQVSLVSSLFHDVLILPTGVGHVSWRGLGRVSWSPGGRRSSPRGRTSHSDSWKHRCPHGGRLGPILCCHRDQLIVFFESSGISCGGKGGSIQVREVGVGKSAVRQVVGGKLGGS